MKSLPRQLSVVGLALIVGWEGFVARPYQDEAGVWTQGYGETQGVDRWSGPVTEAEARATLLRRANNDYGRAVQRCIVRPLSQNQFDAYVSLSYNIGISAFCSSTLTRLHNSGDEFGACKQILRWNKLRQNGVLRVSKGLDNRRKAEYALCVKGTS